ncbi:MAG: hypothetical protein Kow00117_15980 [Phototrophicales bacterium]|nr:MAG: hypothetical protein D6711_01220 [Chloroflexota bacterium]
MKMPRQEMQARYKLFDRFVLKDQKAYYERAIERNTQAGTQVNRIRATFALLTGLSATLAGLIVQISFTTGTACNPVKAGSEPASYCGTLEIVIIVLAICSVAMPVFGSIFSTLSDLYQWDKLTNIFESALENLEVADALSPSDKIPDDQVYWNTLKIYAEGTLTVMGDEASQWGQSIRTPEQLADFVRRQQQQIQSTVDFGLRPDVKPNDATESSRVVLPLDDIPLPPNPPEDDSSSNDDTPDDTNQT